MSPLPKQMKGIIIERTGGPEVLQYRTDIPVPELKEGEVLVKNDFIGINFIDTYFRQGTYPSPKPEVLGREASGTIIATGKGTAPNLQPGAHVVYLATSAYAEYTSVPVLHCTPTPASLPPGHAAASILQGLTAITLVEEAYKVQAGEWILIHAGAGGMGLWLCQTLRAKGARTIATAGTEAKRQLAKANGAEVVVGYEPEEVLRVVREQTGGQGVRAVFDGVGKSTWELSLEAVGRKGSVISFGSASGPVEPFTIARLAGKNVKIARPSLTNYIYTREEFEHYTNELWQMMSKEKFNVQIHEIYPLQDVARAHTDLEGRKTTGKLLLKT